jgi:hypothetical protein
MLSIKSSFKYNSLAYNINEYDLRKYVEFAFSRLGKTAIKNKKKRKFCRLKLAQKCELSVQGTWKWTSFSDVIT